ncbi:MAG: FKBP-type peptidyl-prolyl cis-trans isomerase [Candidatus Levybacteria bacterium]|nr:FKBP-type peptidyl-prolyl cis-trans isomerase [Candidatus Levybacteria bacterium]
MILLVFQSNKAPSIEENPLDFNLNTSPAPTPPPNVTQLQFQDTKVGSGSAQVEAGDTIAVHYIGAFLDGRSFDSSYERREPFELTVGAGQVIPGFEQGVVGMKLGGKRRILIPSNLAYGERGAGPIPPNTPIQFEVELLEIKPKETPTPSPEEETPTPEPEE